jgi:hypothetical protein
MPPPVNGQLDVVRLPSRPHVRISAGAEGEIFRIVLYHLSLPSPDLVIGLFCPFCENKHSSANPPSGSDPHFVGNQEPPKLIAISVDCREIQWMD